MTDRLDIHFDHIDDSSSHALDVFFQDDSMLPEAFPQVARMVEINCAHDPYGIRQEVRVRNDELIGEYGRASRAEMRARRNKYEKSYEELIYSVAKQLYLEGQTDEIELFALDIINSAVVITHPEIAAKYVHEVLLGARETEELSNSLLAELRGIVSRDNLNARYEIAKLIAGDMDDDDESPRKMLLRMMQSTTNEHESPYNEELVTDVEQGLFDSYLASDVIRHAYDNPDLNGNFGTIREYVDSLQSMFGDKLSQDEIRESIASHIASWPDGPAATALGRLRAELASRMRFNATVALRDQGFTVQTPTKPLAQIGREITTAQFKADYNRTKVQVGSNPRRSRGPVVGSGTRTQATMLSKAAIIEHGRVSLTKETDHEEEATPEPRPLVCADGSGQVFDRDSDEFKARIDKFLGKYNQPELAFVLEKALDKLAGLQPGERPQWLKPFNDATTIGSENVRLMQLRPGDIAGISPKGDRGKSLRILVAFVPGSDEILVHKFLDRSKVRTTRRNSSKNRVNRARR